MDARERDRRPSERLIHVPPGYDRVAPPAAERAPQIPGVAMCNDDAADGIPEERVVRGADCWETLQKTQAALEISRSNGS